MIQKKLCMIGASGVGKTSLVARFVHSIFSETYLTTVGVKIDKKTIQVDEKEVMLMIWDLAGDDDFQKLQMSYARGAAGYLFVADGTRAVTLDQVIEIRARVEETAGPAPCILALNKADLAPAWEVDDTRITALEEERWKIIRTSARENAGVEQAFIDLAREMIAN